MNIIHPTAIIESNVQLGQNNYIGPYCHIRGNTNIGDNNRFESFCSIGAPAEHRDYLTNSEIGTLIIGNNNIFREFVTINSSIEQLGTVIGNNNTMLRNSHLGHDSRIGNNITLSCNVIIGGHSIIMDGVNFGLGSICHQFSKIGAYSMIGMGCIITKKTEIKPFSVYIGNPAVFLKENSIGIIRNNISLNEISYMKDKYENL